MDTREGFARFIATPVSFRINKIAGGQDDGGGASVTLDVSDQDRDEAYKLAKMKGRNVEIVWRELPTETFGVPT